MLASICITGTCSTLMSQIPTLHVLNPQLYIFCARQVKYSSFFIKVINQSWQDCTAKYNKVGKHILKGCYLTQFLFLVPAMIHIHTGNATVRLFIENELALPKERGWKPNFPKHQINFFLFSQKHSCVRQQEQKYLWQEVM